jgi:hypothetical protein
MISRMSKKRRLKAFHEAGHAVIARVLGIDVHSISMGSNSDGVAAWRAIVRAAKAMERDHPQAAHRRR